MSYYNATTSSLADLISQLNTFLSGTPGWTTNHNAGAGTFAARKTGTDAFGNAFDIGFASQWNTGTPDYLGIYHWHNAAYNTGVNPWEQNDDSGNGAASTANATLLTARHARITNTPLQLWVFEDDHYFHAVVQVTSTTYLHFGAGLLDKKNSWVGGEYVYGHRQDDQATDPPLGIGNAALLDGRTVTGTGITNAQLFTATIRVSGFSDLVASGKYGVCMGNQSSGALGNDRQTVPKARVHILGGYAIGPLMLNLGQFAGTLARGNLPLTEIVQFHWDRTTDHVRGPLSVMKDVRHASIKNFEPAQEVVDGADTWVFFPCTRKTATTTTGASGNLGVAYKKVTA